MYQIVQAPHPVLSHPAKKVTKIDKAIDALITEMTETLVAAKDPEGVGLAAPQIGKSLQLFIVKPTAESPVSVYINPVIEILSEGKKKPSKKGKKKSGVKLEGCLSLQDIWGIVDRHESVMLSYMDQHGTYHKRKFTGFLATIMQHEYDHLQGVLFPKRVLEQNNKLYKSVKNEDGETIFEEIEL